MAQFGRDCDKVCFIFICLFTSIQMYGILNRHNIHGYYSIEPKPARDLPHIADGERNTCVLVKPGLTSGDHNYMYIRYNAEQFYNIRNVKIFLKTQGENKHTVTVITAFQGWPEQRRIEYQHIPEEIDISILSETDHVYIYILKHKSDKIDFNLCEIEVYGCGSLRFGDFCERCMRLDKCTPLCDVRDGSCDLCLAGFTGATCSSRTSNIAIGRAPSYSGSVYFFDNFGFQNPSLTDGDVTSCSNVDGRTTEVNFGLYFVDFFNITRVNIVLNKLITGISNITDYAVGINVYNKAFRTFESYAKFENSHSIPDVIKLSFNRYVSDDIRISITLQLYSKVLYNKTILKICEVEVYGCKDDACPVCDIENCDKCDYSGTVCHECSLGYKSPISSCTEECEPGKFGRNCRHSCGACANGTCHHVTGTCGSGCLPGWIGQSCNEGKEKMKTTEGKTTPRLKMTNAETILSKRETTSLKMKTTALPRKRTDAESKTIENKITTRPQVTMTIQEQEKIFSVPDMSSKQPSSSESKTTFESNSACSEAVHFLSLSFSVAAFGVSFIAIIIVVINYCRKSSKTRRQKNDGHLMHSCWIGKCESSDHENDCNNTSNSGISLMSQSHMSDFNRLHENQELINCMTWNGEI